MNLALSKPSLMMSVQAESQSDLVNVGNHPETEDPEEPAEEASEPPATGGASFEDDERATIQAEVIELDTQYLLSAAHAADDQR